MVSGGIVSVGSVGGYCSVLGGEIGGKTGGKFTALSFSFALSLLGGSDGFMGVLGNDVPSELFGSSIGNRIGAISFCSAS